MNEIYVKGLPEDRPAMAEELLTYAMEVARLEGNESAAAAARSDRFKRGIQQLDQHPLLFSDQSWWFRFKRWWRGERKVSLTDDIQKSRGLR